MMADIEVVISKLRALRVLGPKAADAGALAYAEVAAAQVREVLGRTSHARGTPTPSPPGSPPAMVTGELRDSVHGYVLGRGVAVVGAGAGYARIQQLGGVTGRDHATTLPARPYLNAALEVGRVEAYRAALVAIKEVITRG